MARTTGTTGDGGSGQASLPRPVRPDLHPRSRSPARSPPPAGAVPRLSDRKPRRCHGVSTANARRLDTPTGRRRSTDPPDSTTTPDRRPPPRPADGRPLDAPGRRRPHRLTSGRSRSGRRSQAAGGRPALALAGASTTTSRAVHGVRQPRARLQHGGRRRCGRWCHSPCPGNGARQQAGRTRRQGGRQPPWRRLAPRPVGLRCRRPRRRPDETVGERRRHRGGTIHPPRCCWWYR